MKIIHTGDVHIGSSFASLSGERAKLRQAEIIDGFRRLCAYACENGVAAVCIAGDLFDGNGVNAAIKRETLSAIERAAPTQFFYVSGNHDDEFYADESLPSNFHSFSRNHGWLTYDLTENVSITGMDTRNFSEENFRRLSLNAARFNLVLLHGDIGQSSSKEYLPLSLLSASPIDYLALGHIHQPTLQAVRLNGRGCYRYCGCLEGRGFDETGVRGFFLLEVANGRLQSEKFYSIATREVRVVRVDIGGCDTYAALENAVFGAVGEIEGKHLVKVVLCGSYSPDLKKDLSLLSRKLGERFFAARVEDESRLRVDTSAYADDRSVYGEFIKEVGRYAFTAAQKEEILEVGLKALRGEEIEL